MGQWTAQEMNRLWRYEEFVGRVMADRRLSAQARDLLMVSGWVLLRDPFFADVTGDDRWKRFWLRLGELTKRDGDEDVTAHVRLVIAADLPQYVGGRRTVYAGPCEGPRLRPYRPRQPRGQGSAMENLLPEQGPAAEDLLPEGAVAENAARAGRCGEVTRHESVLEKDPQTGEHRLHWFCRRHVAAAGQLRQELEEPNRAAPEPVPDRGGLLPCYLRVGDWVNVYRWATGRTSGRFGWEPPTYGVCADDWPAREAAVVPPSARPALVVLPGGLLDAVAGREE